MAVAEAYPELRSQQNYSTLMQQLEGPLRGAQIDLTTASLFVNDHWVAAPRLTLDLGLRFDRDGAFLGIWGEDEGGVTFTRTANGLGPTGVTVASDGVTVLAGDRLGGVSCLKLMAYGAPRSAKAEWTPDRKLKADKRKAKANPAAGGAARAGSRPGPDRRRPQPPANRCRATAPREACCRRRDRRDVRRRPPGQGDTVVNRLGNTDVQQILTES